MKLKPAIFADLSLLSKFCAMGLALLRKHLIQLHAVVITRAKYDALVRCAIGKAAAIMQNIVAN